MKVRSILLAGGLLVLAVVAFGVMVLFKPQPPKVVPVPVRTVVEVMAVELGEHAVRVPTQGRIEPLTETEAASEVAGRIVAVSEAFHAGGGFQAGDVLLEIDPSDYEAALAQAQARLSEARLALENEQARAEQAQRDWKRLAPNERPGPLAQRLPHLAMAQAGVDAADAAVRKAQHDLERTKLRAPYQGRIKAKRADLGDYVSPGTPLADLWRSDVFEVRLPVSLDQFAFIDAASEPEAALATTSGPQKTEWLSKIVRTEGIVDPATRTVSLVARLTNPSPSPLPGLFVNASVEGRLLKNVATIPRRALHGPGRIVIVDRENTLRFRDVNVAWTTPEHAVIDRGLVNGERVCLTALAAVVEGMPVEPIPAATRQPSVTSAENRP
jgi:RND family efflux transporter MFP subunit